MSKYCPTWIIDCIIAEASIDFIELEVGLEFVSKKYTEGIRNIYEDVENVNIYDGVKRIVEICVNEGINQNSNLILSQFSYYKFYFVNKNTQRNFSTLFSNSFFSKVPRFRTQGSIPSFSVGWSKVLHRSLSTKFSLMRSGAKSGRSQTPLFLPIDTAFRLRMVGFCRR